MVISMGLGLLPMIKCSNCGMDVEISAMGDHICAKTDPAASPLPSAPTEADDSINIKSSGRPGPPAPINPSIANRPFLRPDATIDHESTALSPLPSPLRQVQRSQTSPLPIEPQSSEIVSVNSDIPPFPLPRSMSAKESHFMTSLKDAKSAPPVPLPPYASSIERQDVDRLPSSAHRPFELDDEAAPPPQPSVPKDELSFLPRIAHKYVNSIDSKSSYRSSFASSRYGDNNSKRSTAMSDQRPSFSSVDQPYKYLEEDAPPVPSIHHGSFTGPESNMLPYSKNGNRAEDKSTFYLGSSEGTNYNAHREEAPSGSLRVSFHTNSDRLSSVRGSAELFFRSPSQTSFEKFPDPPDHSEERAASTAPVAYKPFRSPTNHAHPSTPEIDHEEHDDIYRRGSDASIESTLSVSNFARALGLDISDHTVENSTVSSDSSHSDMRSGTSFSSLASETSMSRRKPSDQGRLGPVIEEQRIDTRTQHALHAGDRTESPDDLVPPHIHDPLFSPDSPTDPAILQGSVSLVPDKTNKALPEIPLKVRSATGPVSHTANKSSQSDKTLPELPRSATAPTFHIPNKPSQSDKTLPLLPKSPAVPVSHIQNKSSWNDGAFVGSSNSAREPFSHTPKKPSWDDRNVLGLPSSRMEPTSHTPKKPSRDGRITPEQPRYATQTESHTSKTPSQNDRTFTSPQRSLEPASHISRPSWDERASPELPRSRGEPESHIPVKPSGGDRALPGLQVSHIPNSLSQDEGTSPNSATDPAARTAPRPKGPCRGCGERILGKSVSSADGRLTGRYHRECFVCYQCKVPFQTADFYVLRDLPFCALHYHQRNGSLCHTCLTGIEGQYVETNERQGRGPGDLRKFHPEYIANEMLAELRHLHLLLECVVQQWHHLQWHILAGLHEDIFRLRAIQVVVVGGHVYHLQGRSMGHMDHHLPLVDSPNGEPQD
ncbi:hypothetical protein EYZ11_000207 [Aspergillus tanneri]|uniref:LIM zinc-binding domain-containing protein n=1 Tax=Aspergillus tanneri TaxID=1220188 RepID=A0A4S3JY58_9EURO|nr:hypothetical protein EYZ11_000207 [Aspergillus tanneri]